MSKCQVLSLGSVIRCDEPSRNSSAGVALVVTCRNTSIRERASPSTEKLPWCWLTTPTANSASPVELMPLVFSDVPLSGAATVTLPALLMVRRAVCEEPVRSSSAG